MTVLIIVLCLGVFVGCASDSSKSSINTTTSKVEETGTTAPSKDSAYCKYIKDFRAAADEGSNQDGQELQGVPDYVRDQLQAVKSLITESSGDEVTKWEKYQAYLDAYIAAIENNKIGDQATDKEMAKLLNEAFNAVLELAQTVKQRCGIGLSKEFE